MSRFNIQLPALSGSSLGLRQSAVRARFQRSLVGGGEGIRTPDPMVANHVLCQLSYTP